MTGNQADGMNSSESGVQNSTTQELPCCPGSAWDFDVNRAIPRPKAKPDPRRIRERSRRTPFDLAQRTDPGM